MAARCRQFEEKKTSEAVFKTLFIVLSQNTKENI